MKTLIILICSFLLTGCAAVSRYEKNNVVAFGETGPPGNEPLYYLIRIDIENANAAKDVPNFLVVLSADAEPVSLANLTPDSVSEYLPKFRPPDQWPQKLKDKASLYQSYQGNGFFVSFKQGRLSSFSACSNCEGFKYSPLLGKADGSAFYKLPLSYAQILDIWGEPDKLYNVREVTY